MEVEEQARGKPWAGKIKNGVLSFWSREQAEETKGLNSDHPGVVYCGDMFKGIREAVQCHLVCSSSILHACITQCCPEPAVKACQAWQSSIYKTNSIFSRGLLASALLAV